MSEETRAIPIRLSALEGGASTAATAGPAMEFHVHRKVRKELGLETALFSLTGNCVLANFTAARAFAQKYNERANAAIYPERAVKAGQVNAMGLIDEILHYVCGLYREKAGKDVFTRALASIERGIGRAKADALLMEFTRQFPPTEVFRGKLDEKAYLSGATAGVSNRELALEELLMLSLANDDPAFSPFRELFDDSMLRGGTAYREAIDALREFFGTQPPFGPENQNLVDMLRSPAVAVPHSLTGQLEYIRTRWGLLLGKYLLRLLTSLDLVKEEEKPFFPGPGPTRVLVYDGLEQEYERFSPDKDWMPRVVMIAKSALVWLSQLSEKYGRPVQRLDQIPDEELDLLASRGFTALWLIGVWERSKASRRIKRACGNPEASASAYSLMDYDIAEELGGWGALANLRERAWYRGIRLASDMVPNHTGMDSRWINERPDLFVQRRDCPFPGYGFNGENLSSDPGIGVFLEDRYYSRTDAAVVFKRVDFRSGDVRYVYHGNDGTSMPWNDTAQLDFLNPETRAAVMEKILNVARNFPIIRFDAAMVLAKRHIRRLWYPEPGSGGDVPSRSESAVSREDFDRAIPNEFWREVVDLCAREAPDTLLLAEAFWMLEGYFVRTLGMHRVYNSAFMNMLKREENAKYRSTIKNTQEFDPEILKRFVNFLNNPDEETAVAQFGRGDKYAGVCTMMVTMPGLPMFGHGQVEGFEEKYGMEYARAYWREQPDGELVARHEREIFPVMKKRYLFAGAENFLLYDFFGEGGGVNENVFAYSNRVGNEAALVLYNNALAQAWGWIRLSAARAEKDEGGNRALVQRALGDGLGIGAEAGAYALMREQRSDLWFIRDARELWEKGLFVSLNGYQCQVFLDVRGVKDNELAQYRKLCEHLRGAGVRDIQSAMQDIFLEELYRTLAALASPEYYAAFRSLSLRALGTSAKAAPSRGTAEKKPEMTIAGFIQAASANASAFLGAAAKFLGGTGDYGSFEGRRPAGKKAEAEALAYFKESLAAWFAALAAVKEEAGREAEGYRVAFAKAFGSGAFRLEYAAVMPILASLRGIIGKDADGPRLRGLIDHWCVDRKLAEGLIALGCPEDEARHALDLAKTVLSLDAAEPASARAAPKKAPAVSFFEAMASDEGARRLLGVNAFDGKIWYRQEDFDEFLRYACLARIVRGGQKGKEGVAARVEETAELYALFTAAREASGYQLEKLGEFLLKKGKRIERKSEPSAGKAPARKASATKELPKKTPLKKAAEKKGSPKKKEPPKRVPAKESSVKKAGVKKPVVKKVTGKKPAKQDLPKARDGKKKKSAGKSAKVSAKKP